MEAGYYRQDTTAATIDVPGWDFHLGANSYRDWWWRFSELQSSL